MLLFIGSVEPQFVIDRYFNTSHVTVYQPQCYQHQSLYLISIHLMLLFIVDVLATQGGLHNFNTSHVTVYLLYHLVVLFAIIISIHLMLLFIELHPVSWRLFLLISIHLMLLFILFRIPCVKDVSIFQYISCYCLSSCCGASFSEIITFQYISCYCLSVWSELQSCSFRISIHLMLLFIHIQKSTKKRWYRFQYISCYCLSLKNDIKINGTPYFKTSHVTVYLNSV